MLASTAPFSICARYARSISDWQLMEVEALLAKAEADAAELDRPAWEWSNGAVSHSEDAVGLQLRPGEFLGPYRIAHRYVAPYNVAIIYAGLGQAYETFAWLDRAVDSRSYLLSVYLNPDARLDTLHDAPRFDQLHRRVGLPKIK